MDGRSLETFKFHDGTTTISDGAEYTVASGAQTIDIEITSVGTTTVVFEGMGALGVWRPLLGAKMLPEIVLLTETSDLTPFYQFDIIGLCKIRCRLSANSGSPVYVYGKVVG